MSNNDNKVRKLLETIADKGQALGDRPKSNWKTNGILKLDVNVNINTVNSLDKCVKLAAYILSETSNYKEACLALDLPVEENERMVELNNYLEDLKLRSKIILWELDKRKLIELESKLKDLRSEEAKTEDELDNISKNLGL